MASLLPNVAPVAAEGGSPLTAEQLKDLALAHKLTRKLRFANLIALSNVVTLVLFGAFDLVAVPFTREVPFVGLALVALAANEERGRRLLRSLGASATTVLCRNQLLLTLLIATYCGTQAYSAWFGTTEVEQALAIQPGLGDDMATMEELTGGSMGDLAGALRRLKTIVYVVAGVCGAAITGGIALHYRSLGKVVTELRQLPICARVML